MSAPAMAIDHVGKLFVQPLDLAARTANLFGAGMEKIVVHAVDDVTFDVGEGEIVGLIGESGSGKSTLARIVAGIYPPSRGTVRRHGWSMQELKGAERLAATLKIQMIFQDPMASLNPRMRVVDIVGEAPVVHRLVSRAERNAYVDVLLARVGL